MNSAAERPLQNVSKADLRRATAVVARAMANDPMHSHLFPKAERRGPQIEAMYRFWAGTQTHCVYQTSPNMEGVAIWLGPNEEQPLAKQIATGLGAGVNLIATCGIGGLRRMLAFQDMAHDMHARLLPEPHWYLNLVVVDPVHQGKGFASKLIKPFLQMADAQGLPCYLEAQNPKNIPMYLAMGFEIGEERRLPKSDVTNYGMVRKVAPLLEREELGEV